MTLYAVGDLQGCASAFDALLAAIAFDASHDELWLVGDLVNRGPESLRALRRVIGLGAAATAVLGNHDLHLLAAAAGARPVNRSDTFQDVLEAPDRDTLLDWLRERPLLHHDAARKLALVHAGIPPAWPLATALAAADEVAEALRGNHWRQALATMYGSEPRLWSPTLDTDARRRYAINALTRMRFVGADGALDFSESGAPGSQAPGLTPWFDAPGRAAVDVHVVFGHWAALGLLQRTDVTALDSGCVWGGALTAVPLDPPGPPVQVPCARGGTKR